MSRHHLEKESHLHLNAVARYDGALYALFHGKAVIADLDHGKVVIRHDALKGVHTLVFGDDGLATVSDTWGRKVRTYDPTQAGSSAPSIR